MLIFVIIIVNGQTFIRLRLLIAFFTDVLIGGNIVHIDIHLLKHLLILLFLQLLNFMLHTVRRVRFIIIVVRGNKHLQRGGELVFISNIFMSEMCSVLILQLFLTYSCCLLVLFYLTLYLTILILNSYHASILYIFDIFALFLLLIKFQLFR